MTDDLHANQAPVEDSLRTRIAHAVCREYFDNEDVVWQTWRESFNADPEYWCGYADAVIRELRLHVVTVGDFQTVIKGSYPKPLEES